jgi:hypothetical protein
MSFIHRDYNKPRIAMHNNKVMRKSLFDKVFTKSMVGGVQVYGTAQIYQNSSKVRSDKTFKRFLRNIGTSYKEMNKQILETKNIDKVENIYFKMNQSKLLFSPQSNADIADKLNNDYLYDMSVPYTNTATTYYYSQGRIANEVIATLPIDSDIKNYQFVNGTGTFDTTADGFYRITADGKIRITDAGVEPILSDPYDVYSDTINPPTNKMNHDGGSNQFGYTVRRTHLNDTTSDVSIVLKIKRDYIDVQITVGGQYTNTISTANPVAGGTPEMFNDLAALRASIESNAMQYLAGVYPTNAWGVPTYNNTINVGSKRLSMKVADISYNEDWGHELDTLAVLDDGELYDVLEPVIGEVIELTPMEVQRSSAVGSRGTAYTQLFNMSYTYTKRFKVKAVATETSTLITRQAIVASKFPTGGTIQFPGLFIEPASINSAVMDTTIKDAIKNLHTEYYYEDNTIFHRGYLRVDAFNAMTANEFNTVFTKCFDTGFKKKKTKWWQKALAIVIIIIAVVLIILSFLFPPFGIATASLQAAMWALAIGMLFITLAGMAYAKHVGDETGMKMIAGATQVIGIALAIVSICSGYIDVMNGIGALNAVGSMTAEQVAAAGGASAVSSITTTIAVNTAVAGVSLVLGVASFGVNALGMGSERDRQIINAATALLGAYNSWGNFTAGMSAPSVGPVQNVSNFVKLAESGYRGYMAVDAVGTKTPTSPTAEEQAVPEDGVESVFLLETRTVAFDAIEALNEKMNLQYGMHATQGVLQKQYA